MRYICFFSMFLLVACAATSRSTFIPTTATTTAIIIPTRTEVPAYRYLALGDSYTIGQSVAVKDRWPNQLATRLEVSPQLEASGRAVDVTFIARTGWTVDELWNGIQTDPPEGTYDLVTLLIGVNDQYRNYPIDGYREDFRLMLGNAIEYAGGDPNKVIVLSIPDWGFTPFAATHPTEPISQQIDKFNAVNLEETRNAGAQYVDITSISRMAMDDSDLIAGDNLHPSGKMYTMWAEKVLPIALDILSGS